MKLNMIKRSFKASNVNRPLYSLAPRTVAAVQHVRRRDLHHDGTKPSTRTAKRDTLLLLLGLKRDNWPVRRLERANLIAASLTILKNAWEWRY